MKCLLYSAVQFEPHMDNLADLAELIVDTECHQDRDLFSKANGLDNPAGKDVYREGMLREVRTMVMVARARRLGIERR
jgi:hypothetical protein